MNKKLRSRILAKLAQTSPTSPASPTSPTTPTTPTSTTGTQSPITPTLPSPPEVPGVLFAHLNSAYNSGTVESLKRLSSILNIAAYYASSGKDNFQKFVNNNFLFDESSSYSVDQKHLRQLSKILYQTFLNNRNPFSGKVPPNTIKTWADGMQNSQAFNQLSPINPSSPAAQKLPSDLKAAIFNLLNDIRNKNQPTG